MHIGTLEPCPLLSVRTRFMLKVRWRVRVGSFLGHGCVHIHQNLPKIFLVCNMKWCHNALDL